MLMVLFFIAGWGNLGVVLGFMFLLGLVNGPWTIHLSTMIGDSVDYTELETGSRHEGIAFSLQTLMAKVSTAFGALAAGLTLAATGFIPDQAQSPEALNGIFLMVTLVPAASSLVCIIPFRWYKLSEGVHAEIVGQLNDVTSTTVESRVV